MGLIREITDPSSSDVKAVADLHALCFEQSWSRDDFVRKCEDRVHRLFVICDQSRNPIGFVVFSCVLDEAEIVTLGVKPESQGQNVAKNLLKFSFDVLKQSGSTVVFLEVNENNVRAFNLYNSMGFSQIGRRLGYYANPNGEKENALTMSLQF